MNIIRIYSNWHSIENSNGKKLVWARHMQTEYVIIDIACVFVLFEQN